MNLVIVNNWNLYEAHEAFRRCCGSTRWCQEMELMRPFESQAAALEAADRIWWSLRPTDWREAFASHPEIGAHDPLASRYASTAAWSKEEQAGTARAPGSVLAKLAEMNRRYKARFGHKFIVCATGKSAEEMLAMLESQLDNTPNDEILRAAAEQAKITRIRLEKIAP